MHLKKTLIAALSAVTVMTSVIPASAVPIAVPKLSVSHDNVVENVQYRRDQRHFRRYDRHDRRGWYGGHRGHREYRHGYRRHSDGWWYPLAAFGAGAVIGGTISNSRPTHAGVNPRHYNWCASRYRTYRASDNTYVPRVGIRATCRSPYY
jgi:hypothetical protein